MIDDRKITKIPKQLFMRNYQKLDAWKVSMQLVKEIYMQTKNFPKEEIYGMTSQIKRAAVSIPSNIAEGTGRQYKKDTIHFLHISRGSVFELETLINIAVMVAIMTDESYKKIIALLDDTVRLINGRSIIQRKLILNKKCHQSPNIFLLC